MKKILTTVVCCLSMMAAYAQGPMVKLSNGVEMPQFGIGTFNVPSNEICKNAVLTALRAGYRHIDTAHAYMDSTEIKPVIMQMECHPYAQRIEKRKLAEKYGMKVSFPFFVSETYTLTEQGWQLVTLAFTKKM